jgi:hypothetical protein
MLRTLTPPGTANIFVERRKNVSGSRGINVSGLVRLVGMITGECWSLAAGRWL